MAPSPETQEEVEIELRKEEARLRQAAQTLYDIHPNSLDAMIAYANEGTSNELIDAVAANDLMLATTLSHDGNTIILRSMVRLIVAEFPTDSWGSAAHVSDWRSARGTRGKLEDALPGGPPA